MFRNIIEIKSVIRRMRGGSQAFLVRGTDSHVYIAKFKDNPQGNRTLINEWLTSYLLKRLDICVPSLRPLSLSTELASEPALHFQIGNRRIPVNAGIHLGCQVPVDMSKTAIFDFLPRKFLPTIINLPDFAKAFVIDRWVGQTDGRQAIFVRECVDKRLWFRTYLIDHGMSFNGSQWSFRDSHLQGLYFDRTVYSLIDMHGICESAVRSVRALGEGDMSAAVADIPSEWFSEEDRIAFGRLLLSLEKRKAGLADLVFHHMSALGLRASANTEAVHTRISTPTSIGGNSPMESFENTLLLPTR